ncbi:MAG: TonB-dependent receptor plug domain-containing protein, partial [Duncaniella sp.]|nr:TonB-dependent receptor plug domain-containing protein [Duncaniella sp.]
GLHIQQNNAAGSNPNNIPALVIRSTTSLSSGSETGLNQPLIVIDGVESTLQALYDMNIQDIDRVDILKDASATALYGENAANGVIIIERKRVTQAPVRVRYTFTPQFSFADLSSYDMCNAAQKLEFERLAGLYDAANYPANNDGTRLTQAEVDNVYFSKLALINSGQNIDWMSKPVRNSFSHTHSLSVSGRGSCLDYNFTADYAGINGVMKDDSRNRYGFNIYMSYRHDDKLIVTLRADHTSLNTAASPYGSFDDYVRMNPYDSPFDSEGNYRNLLSYNIGNPLYNASLSSFDKTQSRTQNVSLDVRYNFRPNIYVTAQGSYSTTRGTSDRFFSPDNTQFAFVTELGQKGYYLKGNNTADNWAGKVVGNWVQPFDKDGTMMTLNLGWEIKKQKSTGSQLAASGFLSDDLNDLAYATNYYNTILPNGNEDLATSVGGFAAANFIFK